MVDHPLRKFTTPKKKYSSVMRDTANGTYLILFHCGIYPVFRMMGYNIFEMTTPPLFLGNPQQKYIRNMGIQNRYP